MVFFDGGSAGECCSKRSKIFSLLVDAEGEGDVIGGDFSSSIDAHGVGDDAWGFTGDAGDASDAGDAGDAVGAEGTAADTGASGDDGRSKRSRSCSSRVRVDGLAGGGDFSLLTDDMRANRASRADSFGDEAPRGGGDLLGLFGCTMPARRSSCSSVEAVPSAGW